MSEHLRRHSQVRRDVLDVEDLLQADLEDLREHLIETGHAPQRVGRSLVRRMAKIIDRESL